MANDKQSIKVSTVLLDKVRDRVKGTGQRVTGFVEQAIDQALCGTEQVEIGSDDSVDSVNAMLLDMLKEWYYVEGAFSGAGAKITLTRK